MNVLENKIIISVQHDSSKIEALFLEKKVQFFSMPTIAIETVKISESLKAILRTLPYFDYIIFTSKNGVDCFFSILKESNITLSDKIKFAVIGKTTEKALFLHNFRPAIVNSGNTSDDFIELLKKEPKIRNKKLLLVTGDLAHNSIPDKLRNIAETERINVYLTCIPKTFNEDVLNRVKTKNYDWIIFTSPSTFDNLLKIGKIEDKNQFNKIAVIGKTTKKAINDKGFTVDVVSEEASSEGILKSIENYYQNI